MRLDAKAEKIDAHNLELIKNIQDAENHLSNCKNKLASMMKDIDAAKASVEHSFDLTPQKTRIEIDAKDLVGRKEGYGRHKRKNKQACTIDGKSADGDGKVQTSQPVFFLHCR